MGEHRAPRPAQWPRRIRRYEPKHANASRGSVTEAAIADNQHQEQDQEVKEHD